jgi:hypothetical protein
MWHLLSMPGHLSFQLSCRMVLMPSPSENLLELPGFPHHFERFHGYFSNR